MKKIIECLILLLLIVKTVGCQAENWIGEEKARELAPLYFAEYSGLGIDEINEFVMDDIWSEWLDNETPAFIALFFGPDSFVYPTNSYMVYINSHTGDFMKITYPKAYHPVDTVYRRLYSEYGARELVEWSIQQKYELKQEIADVNQNNPDPSAELYYPLSAYGKQLMAYDYRLPNENCISEDEAKRIATDALQSYAGYDRAFVQQQFKACSSFLFSEQFASDGTLIWKIFFIPLSNVSIDTLDFGYFVVVDAYTGQCMDIVHQIYGQGEMTLAYYE